MELYTFVYSGWDQDGYPLSGLQISQRLFSTKDAAQQAAEEYMERNSYPKHKQYSYATVVSLSSVKEKEK